MRLVTSEEGWDSYQALLEAADRFAKAREAYFEAFLRAKISHRNPTDRQAEASAEIEAGAAMVAAEAEYFVAKELFAAACRQKGDA